jgi:DNA-binding LytR/AlgR family response regulator
MKCLVVDDDPIIIELISEYIRRTDFLQNFKTASNAAEALNIIDTDEIDLMFLDIEMPNMTGLEMLATLREPVSTVLITSRKDYALESYEYGVIDYLVKPVDYKRFYRAVQKARKLTPQKKAIASPHEHVFIKVNNQLVRIKLNDILYIEALADYVLIHTTEQQYVVLMTMKNILRKLPDNFKRIHRSFIVNCNRIDSIEESSVIINRKHLTISNTYRTEFMNYLKIL